MRTDAELLVAIANMGDDLLDAQMPEDLVEDEIRALGLNPESVRAEGAEFVQSLIERREADE